MKKSLFLTGFLWLFFTSSEAAATILVPDDIPTIQEAIDAATIGELIFVNPGIYYENITIYKFVMIHSTAGSGSTIISGPNTSQDVVSITTAATLNGFTIDSGRCGIVISSSVTAVNIVGCIISNTYSHHISLPPVLVEEIIPDIDLIPHATGRLNAIILTEGVLSESATWPVPPAGFVYYLANNNYLWIRGSNSPVLHLLPGTVFKLEEEAMIWVGYGDPGGLIADEVIFTSYRDDSVGGDSDGTTTAPRVGDWTGININLNAIPDSTVLTGCEFRYGGKNSVSMVYMYSAATITGCTFSGSYGAALGIRNTRPVVTGCTFEAVVDYSTAFPVMLPGDCVVDVVSNNTFVPRSDGQLNRIGIDNSTLSESATWPVPPDSFVYYLPNYNCLTIRGSNSPVLRLLPGTVFKFKIDAGIQVGTSGIPGGLIADEVIFTSYRDDSVGGDSDGTTTAPAAGDWRGITLDTASLPDSLSFNLCEFHYGGKDNVQMVEVCGVPAEFIGCIFANSNSSGLYVTGIEPGRPSVMYCSFQDNRYGLRLENNGRLRFQQVYYSCFSGNAEYGLYAAPYTDGMGGVSALNCWWGDASGPSGAGPGLGDAITDNVFYDPWSPVPVAICGTTGVEEDILMPDCLRLCRPYPNPFNPTTTFRLELPGDTRVELRIYSVAGRHIRTLVNRRMTTGVHEVQWNGLNDAGAKVKSGVYLYRYSAGVKESSGKLILLR